MATYLQLVQKAVRKSGAKVDVPSTIVSATGIDELFVEWVQDAWKDIQLEHLSWSWRVARDTLLSITSSTDEYAMPSALESVDRRTFSVYKVIADESPLHFINYHYWRYHLDKLSPAASAKPINFTITPDDILAFYPKPDQNYTVRFDGLNKVEILDDTDNSDTPTGIRAEYHDGIMWRAVMYYAAHMEDGAKLQEAQDRFRSYKKYFEEREQEDVTIDTTAMYRSNSWYGY